MREWLTRVLNDGESVQTAPPTLEASESVAFAQLLRAAFEIRSLDIAGPPIAFDANAAIEAAFLVAQACWRLVAEVRNPKPLALAIEPATPSVHLSVDVTFRFLPAAYRRACLRSNDDTLAVEIESLLRRWPLSGVLADLDRGPIVLPEFQGHAGLQMLYAERLVANRRSACWVPADARAREWAERVYQERGQTLPVPIPKEDAGD